VRACSVLYTVYGLKGRVERRVHPYGRVGAEDIVVYGCRVPTTLAPRSCSLNAPVRLPSPPITTSSPTPAFFSLLAASSCSPGVANRFERAVLNTAPPCWRMPPTLRSPNRCKRAFSNPHSRLLSPLPPSAGRGPFVRRPALHSSCLVRRPRWLEPLTSRETFPLALVRHQAAAQATRSRGRCEPYGRLRVGCYSPIGRDARR
jgi:hypothetical protein